MNWFDFAKATLACGGTALLVCSYPLVGQILLLSVLSVLWLAYLRGAWQHQLRKWR